MNNLLPANVNSNFYIECKKGEYNKTLLKFLDFYKEKMSQYFDITKPTGVEYSLPDVDFYYEFKADGIDCFFAVTVELDEKDNSNGGSPYNFILEENPNMGCIAYGFKYYN